MYNLTDATDLYKHALYHMELVLFDKICSVNNAKHRIELQEEFDKIVHYHDITSKKIRDLREWFTAFGVEGDAGADKNA